MKPENPYFHKPQDRYKPNYSPDKYYAWEECFDAIVRYLTEPCIDHTEGRNDVFIAHRYLCPQCMAELEE